VELARQALQARQARLKALRYDPEADPLRKQQEIVYTLTDNLKSLNDRVTEAESLEDQTKFGSPEKKQAEELQITVTKDRNQVDRELRRAKSKLDLLYAERLRRLHNDEILPSPSSSCDLDLDLKKAHLQSYIDHYSTIVKSHMEIIRGAKLDMVRRGNLPELQEVIDKTELEKEQAMIPLEGARGNMLAYDSTWKDAFEWDARPGDSPKDRVLRGR